MSLYLDRYAHPQQLIPTAPQLDLGIVVTIPCFNEAYLIKTLQSLKNCDLPSCSVEVIIIINNAEDAIKDVKKQNRLTYKEAAKWANVHSTDQLRFYVYWESALPKKHAGVGLARKIAMDEAVRRFEIIGHSDGIIVCFDADSMCETNYLIEIEKLFINNPKCPGCSIYFEHPIAGEEDNLVYEAIIDYELFLRYYVNALKFAGFPHAFQTIGSSMAVRSGIYQKQGGMNKRKAGEDFYFLHKIIPLGHFAELKTTKVIPSPRQSDRVPFGTGKAVNDWLQTKKLDTYNINTFRDLKIFYELLYSSKAYKKDSIMDDNTLPASIRDFLLTIDFNENLKRIQNNSGSDSTFYDNFHRWFDGFKVLKYVHFARDNYHPNEPITHAASHLLNEAKSENAKDLLMKYRSLDLS
ncbi:MAG TPA: family 2 glycosyl transferase [Fulvivirga sp.]|nr:family 2 glycosyl transferase [Fulvivirga sp.]